jgi:hypothetical protein
MHKEPDSRRFRLMTLLGLFLIIITFMIGYQNFGSPVRIINDYEDRRIYADRGMWAVTGEIPYKETSNEYPQIPVLIFGLLTWLTAKITPGNVPIVSGFVMIWLVFIMIFYIHAIWQLQKMIAPDKEKYIWFMFLPAVIYFSLNRFDILPVYIGLLVFAFVHKKRFTLAAVLLAIGVFTKWYLGLTLPFILAYEMNCTRRLPWRSVLVFLGVSILIVSPTYLLGGWSALWQPYRWQIGRMVEANTAVWFIDQLINVVGGAGVVTSYVTTFCTLLSFSGVLLVFIFRMDSFRKVLIASVVSILLFILFSRIYSPQWWIWVIPILILLIDNLFDMLLIVGYDILV